MSTFTASSLLPMDSPSTSAEDVWELSRLLITSGFGREGVQLTSRWKYHITRAYSDAEQRWGFQSKPVRGIRARVTAKNPRERWLLQNQFARMATCRALVPLYCDRTLTTAAIAAGATAIPAATSYRRFFAGGRVVIGTVKPGTLEVDPFELGLIASVTPTQINLTVGLSGAYPAGARIYPLMEADLIEEQQAKLNGRLATLLLVGKEVPGASALPALASDGDTTTAFQYEGVYPIFDGGLPSGPCKWSWTDLDAGAVRSLSATTAGLANIFTLNGTRPRLQQKRMVRAFSREYAWKLLTFYDLCSGSLRPFYVVFPLGIFEPVAISTSAVQVKAWGPVSDWNGITHIAITKREAGTGATRIRAIQGSVTRAGDIDTITFATALDAMTLDQVARVSVAYLARFDNEELIERWKTDERVDLEFGIIEVPEEKTVEIDDIPLIDPTPVAASVTVISPNGGETITVGTVYDIRWTSSGFTGNVAIELSTNSGSSWSTIAASVTNSGVYGWTVPSSPTTTARIRVSSVATPATNDTSDADFTIEAAASAATLTVTAPNGGETYTVGDSVSVTWSSANLTGDVSVQYSTDGSTWYPLVAPTADDGAYAWDTTDFAPGSTYRIRVQALTNSAVYDDSNAAFTLALPANRITITSPNGGEQVRVNTNEATITWTTAGTVGNVKIELSTDSGATWPTTIIASTANTGSYAWNTSGLALSDTARIRITDVGTPTITDTSDADFKLVNPGCCLNVAINLPIIAGTASANAALSSLFNIDADQNFTLANPTFPYDQQKIVFRVKHVGAARTPTLGSKFRMQTAVQWSDAAGEVDYIIARYNLADDKFDTYIMPGVMASILATALSGEADLDVLAYNATTTKWNNKPSADTAVASTFVRRDASAGLAANRYKATVQAITISSGALSIDCSQAMQFTTTATGNFTLNTPSNLVDGVPFRLRVKQDATGGRTITFSSGYNLGGRTITLNSTANSYTYLLFIYNADSGKVDVFPQIGGF